MGDLDYTVLVEKVTLGRKLIEADKLEEWVSQREDWIVKAYYRNRVEYDLYILRPWAHQRMRFYWAFVNEYYYRFGKDGS